MDQLSAHSRSAIHLPFSFDCHQGQVDVHVTSEEQLRNVRLFQQLHSVERQRREDTVTVGNRDLWISLTRILHFIPNGVYERGQQEFDRFLLQNMLKRSLNVPSLALYMRNA